MSSPLSTALAVSAALGPYWQNIQRVRVATPGFAPSLDYAIMLAINTGIPIGIAVILAIVLGVALCVCACCDHRRARRGHPPARPRPRAKIAIIMLSIAVLVVAAVFGSLAVLGVSLFDRTVRGAATVPGVINDRIYAFTSGITASGNQLQINLQNGLWAINTTLGLASVAVAAVNTSTIQPLAVFNARMQTDVVPSIQAACQSQPSDPMCQVSIPDFASNLQTLTSGVAAAQSAVASAQSTAVSASAQLNAQLTSQLNASIARVNGTVPDLRQYVDPYMPIASSALTSILVGAIALFAVSYVLSAHPLYAIPLARRRTCASRLSRCICIGATLLFVLIFVVTAVFFGMGIGAHDVCTTYIGQSSTIRTAVETGDVAPIAQAPVWSQFNISIVSNLLTCTANSSILDILGIDITSLVPLSFNTGPTGLPNVTLPVSGTFFATLAQLMQNNTQYAPSHASEIAFVATGDAVLRLAMGNYTQINTTIAALIRTITAAIIPGLNNTIQGFQHTANTCQFIPQTILDILSLGCVALPASVDTAWIGFMIFGSLVFVSIVLSLCMHDVLGREGGADHGTGYRLVETQAPVARRVMYTDGTPAALHTYSGQQSTQSVRWIVRR